MVFDEFFVQCFSKVEQIIVYLILSVGNSYICKCKNKYL